MNALRTASYYHERAQNVDLTEITSSYNNAEILQMLRDDDPWLSRLLIIQHDNDDDMFGVSPYHFHVQEGDDLGWLGYFIGRNTVLIALYIILPDYRRHITALLGGIEQNRSIRYLSIPNLGESVLGSLSTMLQYENCRLSSLVLHSIRLSDDAAVALTDVLKGNKSLAFLLFNPDDLTQVGWSAFSKLLCDTSSASNIYASNHSLSRLGNSRNEGVPDDVKRLLDLNRLALTDKEAADTKYRRYSSGKKEKFDLLGRNFIVMCTFLLLCLLFLFLPTWGHFIAALSTLCVLLLQVVSVYS